MNLLFYCKFTMNSLIVSRYYSESNLSPIHFKRWMEFSSIQNKLKWHSISLLSHFIVNIISVQNRLYVRFKWYVTWRITQFSNLLTPHWSSIVNRGDLKTSAWDALHHFTNKYCPINRSMSYQSQTHVTCYEKWPWPNFRVVLEYKNVHILKNVLTSIFYRF